ncbi:MULTISPECIES: TetR/AcrR family transcriptional regulator [Devosia]|uniref:Bacterial regulatory proteins, tetR family n=1 Tax=Devosia equisanguinis TaxID=2490941 RepID=A0A447I7N3_9HYPH|nr:MULTISPECIES: TetR/AcrR family transcriptional regulator [Devosia]ODT47851.1 MAG: TetR family transcriptional regulator [Pelagibacterium sp. SCN 63-126]OJX42439.1 MAG: TetR family transcriptional regulator [Devosia sp. 63-57]VDS03509.1 Bacterial regulatory proteins, tetR family [Devosia equisanguinis]
MGRKPTISRDGLLTIAEEIVNADGPQTLTIDALAKAAGISKGGVQYAFASKDDLIRALVDRWTTQFDALIPDVQTVGPIGFVRAYIAAMRSSQAVIGAKMAGLMIAYMQNPKNRLSTVQWYSAILEKMGDTQEARTAKAAFLAVEGLFALRIWGVESNLDWQSQLDDIEAIFLDHTFGKDQQSPQPDR